MSKYIIGQRVKVWDMGEIVCGTIYGVRKKILSGVILYTVAIKKPNGFDSDGIGIDKYIYKEYTGDCIWEVINE